MQEEAGKIPTLDDVMSAEELEQVTAEGLAANPVLTPDQEREAAEKAAQMEGYMNYLKQQRFFQFMAHRPQPVTIRTVDWATVRYQLIVHEKSEFDHMPEIKALTDMQWYHGIVTGNVAVYNRGELGTFVHLRHPYIGHSTMVQQPPETAQGLQGNRQQRRKLH